MHRTSAVRMMSGRLTFESDFAAIVRLLPQLGYARDNGVEGGSRTKECRMISPKISRQEWPVMEELWRRERLSIREIQTALSGPDRRPAYSTVQTMVYRLEARGAVRRVEKIREARSGARTLRFFEGRVWPFLEQSIAMGSILVLFYRS